MSKIRRIADRVEASHWRGFDEEVWPVNVALLILAGVVGGGIIALSDFRDAPLLSNGWFRLSTLVITIGLAMWGAMKLPSRRFRHAMQLAIVCSLLVHLVMMIFLYNQRQVFLEQQMAENEAVEEFETPVELPDYHEPDPETPEEYEKPVATETPSAEQPATEIAREQPPVEAPKPTQIAEAPTNETPVPPSQLNMAELAETAPRRAEAMSVLSKQTAPAEARPNEPIAAPAMQEVTPDSPAAIDASSVAAARTEPTAPGAGQPGNDLLLVPPTEQQTTQIARRDAPETPAMESPSMPVLNRPLNEPSTTPRIDADAPQVVAENPSVQPDALQPNSVAIGQQSTAPMIAQQAAPDPIAGASPTPGPVGLARQTQNDAPQLATGPVQSIERAAADAQAPGSAVADAPQVASQGEGSTGTPGPAAMQVTRSEAQAPGDGGVNAIGNSPSAAPTTIAGSSIARAESATAPSILPDAPPGAAPSRSVQVADAVGSPINFESPAMASGGEGGGVGGAGNQSGTEVAPAATTIARGSGGIGGLGGGGAADGGAAGSAPTEVVTAAASRAQGSQTEPPGPAAGPSAPALVPRATAGADVAQSVYAAQDVAAPTVGGADQPGKIDVDASAALARAAGSAPPGKFNAAAGKGEVDLGAPSQVALNLGTGAAAAGGPAGGAGGGGPTINIGKPGAPLARAPPGGASIAALAGGAVASVPQAPAGSGGGAPAPGGGLDSTLAAATKSSAGGTVTVPGIVSPGVGGGVGLPAAGGGGVGGIAGGGPARATAGQDVLPGPPSPGGTRQPGRSIGRVAMGEIKADAPQISVGPVAGQPSAGGGLEARGDVAVKSVAGLPGKAEARFSGAGGGPAPIDSSIATGLGLGLSARPAAAGGANEAAPAVGPVSAIGAIRKTNVAGVPGGAVAAVELPAMVGGQPGGNGETPGGSTAGPGPIGPSVAGGESGRQPGGSGAVVVQVAAIEGPGGLGGQLSVDVGRMSRHAHRDSEIVSASTVRFVVRNQVGGPLPFDDKAREPATAYARRRGRPQDTSGAYAPPSAVTEKSIDLGLDFLAQHQAPDGRWSLHEFGKGKPGYENETADLHSDTAATALALLAFLGAGYDHYDDQYQTQVRRGLEFLLKHQREDGDLFLPAETAVTRSVWLYSHGVATVALCEAFGMTGDADLREPGQKAIDFITAAQDPKHGGWVYTPGRVSDTSVTGWQLMALKSGELAGMKVPQATFKSVEKFLDTEEASPNDKQAPGVDLFVAGRNRPQLDGTRLSPATTSMELLMRLYYSGWNRTNARMKAGGDFLLANPPQMGTATQPRRDSYYWYYATQLLFHMQGDYWKKWNEQLYPILLDNQVQSGPLAGSWDPKTPVEDRWGTHGGRIYVTALNLLSLEVYYRHLPVYEQEAK